jgi:hypothetical protein
MAHTFVNKSQDVDQSATTITIYHTPGAVATVAILSIVTSAAVERTGGAPTIDGTTATQADVFRTGIENGVEVWYVCKAFDAGEFTVVIPNAGALTCNCEIVTADAGTGYDSEFQSAAGVAETSNVANGITVDVTSSAVGDFLYCRLGCGENDPASITETSTNPTKTLTYSNDHGAESSRGDYALSDGAGTETFTYVWTKDDGCCVAVAFKSVAAGASPLSVSESDKSDVTDSTAVQFNELVASASDSASVDDATSVELNELVASVSDSVAADDSTSDSIEGIPPLTLSAADNVYVDEGIASQLNELYVSLSDSIDTLETVQRLISAEGEISESDQVGIADSAAASLDLLLVAATDEAGLSESVASALDVLQVAVSDAIASLEQVSAACLIFREASASDGASLADSVEIQLDSLIVSGGDQVGVSEALAALRDTLDAALEDAATVSDAAYALLDVVPLQISDAVIIADSTNVAVYDQEVTLSISDSIGVSEGYPVRTIPDPTKAGGNKSYGSDAGHKSKGLKSE